jgi:hypothetical protein
LRSLKNSAIRSRDFENYFPKGQSRYTQEIILLINETLVEKNAKLLNDLLVIADSDGLSRDYTNLYCSLLKENWHYSHEDLVMYLETIKDPQSVECIFQVTSKEQDFYEDEPHPLTQKCIWALGAINSPESIEKIKQLATSSGSIVKEIALLELEHRIK